MGLASPLNTPRGAYRHTPHTSTSMNTKPETRWRWWARIVTSRRQRQHPTLEAPRTKGLTHAQNRLLKQLHAKLQQEIDQEHDYFHYTTFPIYSMGVRDGLALAWDIIHDTTNTTAKQQQKQAA